MTRTAPLIVATAWVAVACTEPNPFAAELDGGSESSSGDGDPSTGDGDGDPEPASFAFATVEFSLQGNDSFTAEIPKPAGLPQTAPIAVVRRYQPGQSQTLGWTVTWTESATSWTVEVQTAGASPNSRIAGVAAVLGFADSAPAPTVEERTVTTADGCASLPAVSDAVVLDSLESYAPGEAPVFEISRTTATAGDATTIEYCVNQPGDVNASITVKLVAFALPDGVVAAPFRVELDGQNDGSEAFTELGQAGEAVHLIGLHGLAEAAAPSVGWQLDCAATPPFACDYTVSDAADGVTVVLGGAALASP